MSSKETKPARPTSESAAPKSAEKRNSPNLKAEEILVLFAKNLKAIREWYAAAPGRGIEVGHYTVGEIAAGDTLSALTAALEGRTWQPPTIPGA